MKPKLRSLTCCLFALIAFTARADRLSEPLPGPSFELTNQNEEKLSSADLKGKIWVADFVFTNCGGPCPIMTQKMVALARRVSDPNVRFISFSVDPERDTPAVLRQYAKERGATDPRMHFLTGTQAQTQAVAQKMLLPFFPAQQGQQILHAERFVILDQKGQLRATFNPLDSDGLDLIVAQVEDLQKAPATGEKHPLIDALPPINAMLNAAAALLLCIGLGLVLNRKYTAHAVTMILALLMSTIFLACYLTLHYLKWKSGVGLTKFPESSFRPVYIVILTSHTILAIVVLPMVIATVILAARRSWAAHRRLARPTFWIWLYVSVTGVVVYWMLYQLAPRLIVTPAA